MTDIREAAARPLNVTILGVGRMGSAFARRLLDAGMFVRVWDPDPAAAQRLASDGARVEREPRFAVRHADVAITMVPNLDAIEATMSRALPEMKRDAIWLQMSTLGLGTERAMALLREHRSDLAFVDAPVSGTKRNAEDGTLLILASGPPAALDALAPVFGALGRKTLRWERAGTGSRVKLVLSTWLSMLVAGMAEVAALAETLDVPLPEIEAILQDGPLGAPLAIAKLEKMAQWSFEPEFALAVATNDVQLAVRAALRERRRLPVTEAVAIEWQRALEMGYGDRDVSAAYLALVDGSLGGDVLGAPQLTA